MSIGVPFVSLSNSAAYVIFLMVGCNCHVMYHGVHFLSSLNECVGAFSSINKS